jgi:hypothetical protein
MNQGIRRFVVPAAIFVLGVALYVLMLLIGIAVGLPTATAQWLAFGGLAAYFLALVIVVRTRRRNAPPGGFQ